MSTLVLLDTCVASYIFKGDSRAAPYLKCTAGQTPCLSFMTVAELYRWPGIRGWGEIRTHEFLKRVRTFSSLPSDDRTCWLWAELMNTPGRPMPSADAWVAATALAHSLPLLTHNQKDFEHIAELQLVVVE
jgi:tRNA(fMet)-specific endonuclease VapC